MPKRPATASRRSALRPFLIAERERAGLSQAGLARKLGESQSWVARIENGRRLRVDVVEFLALAEAIGFDPVKAVHKLRWGRSE